MWKCHLLISSRLRNCPCGSFLLLPHIAASAANLGKANLPFSPTQIYVFIVFSSATDVSAKAGLEEGLKLLDQAL